VKVIVVVAALALTQPLSAQAAPRVASRLSGSELTTLEAVRKAVWVDWFSGDTTALRHALGPELVAMGIGTPHWQSLDETIASSAKFKADGGRFVSVSFDSTTTHCFGNVVVMFSHFAVTTEGASGQTTRKGRATEVFVRSNNQWVHTSWHLDATS
jgi:hypothetical protein